MRSSDLKALEFDKLLEQVCQFAVAEPIRKRIRELRPANDPGEVSRRLAATQAMVELRQRAGAPPLQEFSDQRPLIRAASRADAVLPGSALSEVRNFILAADAVANFLRPRAAFAAELARLAEQLPPPRELRDELVRAVTEGGYLSDDASPNLRRLREQLRAGRRELEERLFRALHSSHLESVVSELFVTVRNRRFVIPLKPNFAEHISGVIQDRSVSGETFFVEPSWAVPENNRLLTLEREIEAEEFRILRHLTALMRHYRQELEHSYSALVEFATLNAYASFAEVYQCSRPEIVSSGIDLRNVRHPLLQATGRPVTPIDIRIAPDRQGILISGPNMAGKTAAVKTLGLLTLMAQSGLLVPAEPGSRLPVFRAVYADIGDAQSLTAGLSTFAAHIENLREILSSGDEPALIILDEPGAGTDPDESAALTIALIRHLESRRSVLALTSHSHQVKLFAYGQSRLETAAVDFDFETFKPLYKLRFGTIERGYGLAIARRLGLPDPVVRMAETEMPGSEPVLEGALRRLELERQRLAEQEAALERQRREWEEKLKAQEAELDEARRQVAAERRRLHKEMEEAIESIRQQGAELLEEIRRRRRSRRDLVEFVSQARSRADQVTSGMLGGEETPVADADRLEIKLGDMVEISDTNLRGELVALRSGKAVVSKGGLRIDVAPERLRRVREGSPAHNRPGASSTRGDKAYPLVETVARIDLTGMRPSDAVRKLEEFLDRAYLSMKSEVRIIHGHGSGALRKAVHDYLASSPYCATFRDAAPEEDSGGVTIVTLP